jgi:hypothetical protein
LVVPGCLTIGPVIERKAIIIKAGTAIEVLEQVEVDARVMNRGDSKVDVFRQDIGGWITMHPDHWDSLKREIQRLRKKAGEDGSPND